jgi:hypothetical protein
LPVLSVTQIPLVITMAVSDYGLKDRAIWVRSSPGAHDFSCSPCVQTGSGAHPASCTMDTGGPFPGRGVTLTTHPSSAEVEWVGAIPPLPQASPWCAVGQLYLKAYFKLSILLA